MFRNSSTEVLFDLSDIQKKITAILIFMSINICSCVYDPLRISTRPERNSKSDWGPDTEHAISLSIYPGRYKAPLPTYAPQ